MQSQQNQIVWVPYEPTADRADSAGSSGGLGSVEAVATGAHSQRRACKACRRSHTRCDVGRPCARCSRRQTVCEEDDDSGAALLPARIDTGYSSSAAAPGPGAIGWNVQKPSTSRKRKKSNDSSSHLSQSSLADASVSSEPAAAKQHARSALFAAADVPNEAIFDSSAQTQLLALNQNADRAVREWHGQLQTSVPSSAISATNQLVIPDFHAQRLQLISFLHQLQREQQMLLQLISAQHERTMQSALPPAESARPAASGSVITLLPGSESIFNRIGYVLLDQNAGILAFNTKACEVLGRTPQQMMLMGYLSVMYPEESWGHRCRLALRALANQDTFSCLSMSTVLNKSATEVIAIYSTMFRMPNSDAVAVYMRQIDNFTNAFGVQSLQVMPQNGVYSCSPIDAALHRDARSVVADGHLITEAVERLRRHLDVSCHLRVDENAPTAEMAQNEDAVDETEENFSPAQRAAHQSQILIAPTIRRNLL